MRRSFTPREASAIRTMLNIRALHHGPACAPVGDWLVRQAKRTWPPLAGYRGPQKTNNKRSWTVVSYHHPAQLCWVWSLWFSLFPRVPLKWRAVLGRGHGQYWLRIPFIFSFTLHTQFDSTWMLSSAAKQRLRTIACGQIEAVEAA